VMDVIPLDATLVKGAHGRIPESHLDKPLLVCEPTLTQDEHIAATAVFDLILKTVQGR
jgi:hypothetical protein